MDEKEKISFQIKGILVKKFDVDLKDEFIRAQQKNPSFSEYTFKVDAVNKGIVDSNLLITEVSLKVYLDKEKKTDLGHIIIDNIFEIENLKRFLETSSNVLNLPFQFEASLVGISLSHARAIFITKCAGTFLQNAILPIMNPSEMLKPMELPPS